jgi:hypothetical protein
VERRLAHPPGHWNAPIYNPEFSFLRQNYASDSNPEIGKPSLSIVGFNRSVTVCKTMDHVSAPPGICLLLPSRVNSDGTLGPFQETTPFLYTLHRYLCGVVNNDFIYAIGGISNASTTSSVIYGSIQSDGAVGQWAYTTSLPKSLQLQGAFAN